MALSVILYKPTKNFMYICNMENKEITIFCKNDGKNHRIEMGGTLGDLSKKWCKTVTDSKTGQKLDVIAALVDNKLKEL